MKKYGLWIVSLLAALCLTGCEVHWNGQTADVPWPFIAVPAGLVLLIGILINGTRVSAKRFVCPKCHHTFKPVFWRCMLAPHSGDEHLLRCPQCHAREACHLSYEQDE